MKRVVVCFLVMLGTLSNCGHKNETKILFIWKAGYNRRFHMEQVPFNDEKQVTIDCGIAKNNLDSFYCYLPKLEDRVYQINIEGKGIQIPFINDSKEITIFYDAGTGYYNFEHSDASTELKKNSDNQLLLAEKSRRLSVYIDTLKKDESNKKLADSAKKVLDNLYNKIYKSNFDFADTVHNAAIFMTAYNLVDFGNNHNGLKKFILNAGKRFPEHQAVQLLVKHTLAFLKGFDEPYRVRDSIPALILPDKYGNDFSTYSIKNKFILLDFWSTWCTDCKKFSEAKKLAKLKIDTNKFEIISIAVDAEKTRWKYVIKKENYSWPQLIDEQMWNGSAFKTLKFDSIPFNFLIDPNRRIVAKAIPADSLLIVLSTIIKSNK